MKTLAIIGSTGSIGMQTLEVARHCGFSVLALAAHHNIERLEEQAREFHPKLIAVAEETAAAALALKLRDTDIKVVSGQDGVLEVAGFAEAEYVVLAAVGVAGLAPTLRAIEAKKKIALANKETLVCAGSLVMSRAKELSVPILPVDSEHSAIFQSLQGSQHGEIRRLLLTASGGPFFGKTRAELEQVTLAQALKHPNWTMGAKVTIDSATLMNKGLEFLEAMALFDVPPEKIYVLVHRESIIHSMVEYCDNAVIAQLGTPDMRLPIQYALTFPERTDGAGTALDLLTTPHLSFAPPDLETFPCLALAMQVAREGGLQGAVLNAANEIAVARFLKEEIGFLDIPRVLEQVLARMSYQNATVSLEGVLAVDAEARRRAEAIIASGKG